MEQGVPGSQHEPFFELLHPNASRAPPPPPPPPPPPRRFSSSSASSADHEADVLAPDDPSPVPEISPSYEFHLTHSSKPSEPIKSDLEDSPPFSYPRPSFAASEEDHQQVSTNDTEKGPEISRSVEVMETSNQVTMAAIDLTLKNYTDNLLHVLQSMSERVLQLESTVQGLERTMAGFKMAEGEKHERSNGRLMQLELLVQEVHTGMRLLHDKYKLEEAKSHLTNVYLDDQKVAIGGVSQTSADGWQQSRLAKEEGPPAAYSEPPSQLAQHAPPQYPLHAQSHYPHAPPQAAPQLQAYASSQNMLPLPPSLNGPSNPPAAQQPYLPSVQHLSVQPSAQQVPQPPQPLHSIQATSFHAQPPQPQSPSQSTYNLSMETTAYGHMQPQHHHQALPTPPNSAYQPEPQHYATGMHGGLPRQQQQQQQPPQEMIYPSPQQHNPVVSQHGYESIGGRLGPAANSMAPPSYSHAQPAKLAPMYDTSGSGYGMPPYRTAQPVPSAPSGGGGGYPRLPTAQPLQHSLSAAAGGNSGALTRTPLEEVIEKVAAMGFSKDQVRGVVRQLTENGQAVDMNVVLDKLMNGGDAAQAPRGWFGRR